MVLIVYIVQIICFCNYITFKNKFYHILVYCMMKIKLPNIHTLFSFVGIIVSLLFFNFSAQGQITASGCGTATVSQYQGFSSIFKIDVDFAGTYHCGEGFGIYKDGALLHCGTDLANNTSLACRNYNGGGVFDYSNNNNPELRTFYLDTRRQPYTFSETPPTNNSIDIIQSPDNFVAPNSSVTFTAEAVILDGSAISGYKWFRNGAEIPGQTGTTLSEIPPSSGTRYSVEVQTSGGALLSEEKTVLLTSAQDGRFTINGAAATIFALDACNSIYELDVTLGGAHYTTFQIYENGNLLKDTDLSVSGAGLSWNGDNIVSNSHGTNLQAKWYINTRNGKPYELTNFQPFDDPAWFRVELSVDRNFINEGESVQLTANACPAGAYTYEWYENGVKEGETNTNTFDITPRSNGSKYTVIITEKSQGSNEEIVYFNNALNNGIYQIPPGGDRPSPYTTLALDGCFSIYKLDFTLPNRHYIRFTITENGVPLTVINTGDTGLSSSLEYNNGVPELQMYRNLSDVGNITYYLNTNTEPYTLTTYEPAPPADPAAKIEGETAIFMCDPISLSVSVCPDFDNEYTYIQWYKNNLPVTTGGNNATLNDPCPVAGDTYYVEATKNKGLPTEYTITSLRPATVSFVPRPSLGATNPNGYSEQLNWYEYNVRTGDEITFTLATYNPNRVYTFQYKSLEVGSQWRDTAITPTIGTGIAYTITPLFGAKYRIKGIDVTNGCGCAVENYSDSSLVRFIYDCTGGDSWNLFSEDFGRFAAGTYHYGNNQSTTANVHNLAHPAGSYWAADPHIPMRVQNHSFAWEQGGVYSWCPENGGRRIEDGFYAIVNNPGSGDCGNLDGNGYYDYWRGTDHTQNPEGNGGMLFVNVGGSAVDEVVYEQEITIDGGCRDVKVLFSAFISNANSRPGQTPVDVRLDVLDATRTNVLHSISSGEVIVRTQADVSAGKAWANLSFKFDAEENATYYVQLTNNGQPGYGNDILIDDILVTICVPQIDLELTDHSIIDFGNAVDIGVCEDEVIVPLQATLAPGSGDITDLFPTPIYQFQYSRDNGATWTNFTTSGNIIDIELIHEDDLFRDYTLWRIIVAGSQAVIDGVGDGSITEPSCNNMFLRSNIITIDFDHREYPDIEIDECFSQNFSFIAEIPDGVPGGNAGRYEWYHSDEHGNTIGAPIRTGVWTAAQPTVTITGIAPNTTTPDYYVFRPISPYDCEFDYLVTVTGRDCDDLVLTKNAAPRIIDAGGTVVYTVEVENQSLFPSKNIIVNDVLPTTMSYRSHTIAPATAGTYSNTTGDWNVGRLEVGEKATLTITVQNIGGADSDIINYTFIKNRIKEADQDELLSFPDYNTALQQFPAFTDTAKIYVNPQEAPGIIGVQPCKNDVVTYSLNTSLIPVTPRAQYQWSITPANSGALIQGSTTNATLDVKYYNAPAAYIITCEIIPDSDVLDPPIVQSKCVYVTDVPNVSINGKMHVCYGDVEKYFAYNDNIPDATYSWTLMSGKNELIIDGANAQTSTIEWLRNDGGLITIDRVLVEATNTVTYEADANCERAVVSCSNSAALDVFVHKNPPAQFSYENNNMMYFHSEPSYRHTDTVYTDMTIDFINESHLAGYQDNTIGVVYYWDFAGDGVFTQTSYNAAHTYHDAGKYTVQLHALDTIWGCRTRIDVPLVVLPNPNCLATFPNAFTPDKLTNKEFGALYTNGVMLEGFELRVFDRWGTMVWSTNNPNEYWNGMVRGEIGKQDVYVYHCKAKCQDIDPKTKQNKTLSIKGDVTLIR